MRRTAMGCKAVYKSDPGLLDSGFVREEVATARTNRKSGKVVLLTVLKGRRKATEKS
jgi:hypothetical protein